MKTPRPVIRALMVLLGVFYLYMFILTLMVIL